MKPSLAPGTRDFTPLVMKRRNYIFSTIRSVFENYGFEAIETPSFEKLETLTGKYGTEGDQLIFKLLNSGDYLKKAQEKAIDLTDAKALLPYITEKALRYDLTIPFARFVVMHQNEITFPFKRYQIQPVWRADRPQKGRYREFYQCDGDVVGSTSLLNEVELFQIIDAVFHQLKVPNVVLKVNSRKILSGIAEVLNATEQLTAMTTAIDKLDKIGVDKVCLELQERGFDALAIERLKELLEKTFQNYDEALSYFKNFLAPSTIGLKGLEELETVFNYFNIRNEKPSQKIPLQAIRLVFDANLARGLNYYTGLIFEAVSEGSGLGSIVGGGRYDNLTGLFDLPNLSGVGLSFGADRIYDILLDQNLFDAVDGSSTEVLFLNLGAEEEAYILPLAYQLRALGVNVEVYPDCGAKLKKQMEYANKKRIAFVIIIGERERETGKVSLKNMITGEQQTLEFNDILANYKIR